MNKYNTSLIALLLCLFTTATLSAQHRSSSAESPSLWANPMVTNYLPAEAYSARFSLSHGHCALPLEARLVSASTRYQDHNLSNLRIDFEVGTASLKAVRDEGGKWTREMQAADGFHTSKYPKMKFVSRDCYNWGDDWLVVVGDMTIKGKTERVQLRATPIYSAGGCNKRVTKFVLDGELNADLFGIGTRSENGASVSETLHMRLLVKAVKTDGC